MGIIIITINGDCIKSNTVHIKTVKEDNFNDGGQESSVKNVWVVPSIRLWLMHVARYITM